MRYVLCVCVCDSHLQIRIWSARNRLVSKNVGDDHQPKRGFTIYIFTTQGNQYYIEHEMCHS